MNYLLIFLQYTNGRQPESALSKMAGFIIVPLMIVLVILAFKGIKRSITGEKIQKKKEINNLDL